MFTTPPSLARRVALALALGIAAAVLCGVSLRNTGRGAGDLTWSLRAADLVRAGQNPYGVRLERLPYDPHAPFWYPLPVALLALPLLGLPEVLAAALFSGMCGGVLAFALTRDGYARLPTLLGAPYLVALVSAQWSPLLMAAGLLPAVLPLAMLIKPNFGLALWLTCPTWRAPTIAAALGLLTLLIMPRWPLDWLSQVGGNRYPLPITILPGPLVLLALVRWRRPEARLLLLLALAPQQLLWYDQLLLWLIPRSARGVLALSLTSWMGALGWMLLSGASLLPPGHSWLVGWTYLPALALVLWPGLDGERVEASEPSSLPA